MSGYTDEDRSPCRKLLKKTSKHSNIIKPYRCKCNFREELKKIQASHPVVWKYPGAETKDITALEPINIDVQTFEGEVKTDVLLSGNSYGSLRFLEVRKEQGIDETSMPVCVKNYAKGKTYKHGEVPPLVVPNCAGFCPKWPKQSRISCIRLGPKLSSHADGEGPNVRHALVTYLGCGKLDGSVHIMDLAEPLVPDILISPIQEVASIKGGKIWTAEYDCTRSRAVIGTNKGAKSVDLETRQTSEFVDCKSDVFAEQILNSGNSILCGVRNGSIIAIDFRERRDRFSSRCFTQRIPYPPLGNRARSSNKGGFTLPEDICSPQTTRMPSSVSSLLSLQSDDQYFLASSMDGSVRLYDHRLLQRGAVQSYEGHVNSRTHIHLGVDPHERFVMSGGEDCYLRIWNIKSGELLFEDKFSDTVLSTVCADNVFNPEVGDRYKDDYPLSAWLASEEELYYVNWFSI